jgi:hypothetical protein
VPLEWEELVSYDDERRAGSHPLVAGDTVPSGARLLTAHTDQYHFMPAPSTDTNATTGATLADQRTTVTTVDDFFMSTPPSDETQRGKLGR